MCEYLFSVLGNHFTFHDFLFYDQTNHSLTMPWPVLESQLFSGFWIGWMIEHPAKSNSEIPKMLHFQSTFNVKNPKNWIFGFLLDFYWIGLDF
jgi:hypothetical protein